MIEMPDIDIIHEDNHLLVVNKPSGVLSQGDQTGDLTILDIGKAYIKVTYDKPGEVFLGLPHRLDRPTSGIMVLCKTSKSLTRMTQLIKDRDFEKEYLCITKGKTKMPQGRLINFLKKDTKRNKAIVRDQPFKGAKEAILNYELKGQKRDRYLYSILLETGRPHQIRAQMSNQGAIILGDKKYGMKKPLPDKSIALHARRLKFIHPVSKTELNLVAHCPSDAWWKAFSDLI